MTKTTKIAASVLMVGAVALSILPSAQANPITGTVSFTGGVTGYENTTGTGATSSDFTQDHSLVFAGVVVAPVAAQNTGTFAGLGGDSVTIYSPLQINPTGTPPVPGSAPLWSIGGTTLTFSVTTLNQSISTPPGSSLPNSALNLFGTGTLSDGIPADSVTGTWNATFTSAIGGAGQVTFSFNSSTGVTVPDGGTSLVILGLGLTALAGFARFRKQVA
jgi:hypothetical protein